jgi:hypothetical protein
VIVPVRLQLSRRKGFKLPPNTINCARPGPLGNPFVVGKDRIVSRAEAVRMFIALMDGYIALSCGPPIEAQRAAVRAISSRLPEIKGNDCACWCRLPKPGEADVCHAAVILCLANHDTPAARRAALKPIMDACNVDRLVDDNSPAAVMMQTRDDPPGATRPTSLLETR